MKTQISATLLAIATCGLAMGQTVYTSPVGYVTASLPAGSDTAVSIPLVRSTYGLFSVSSVSSGNVLNITGTITPSGLTYVDGTQDKKYFVLVTQAGSFSGKWYPVVSNGSSSITVDNVGEDLSTLTGAIKVMEFWTLGTAMPSGAGIVASTSPSNVKSRLLFNDLSAVGQNIPRSQQYVYFDLSGVDNDGWYDPNDLAAGKKDDVVIFPDEFFVIRNSSGVGPSTLSVSGEVFMDTIAVSLTVQNSSLGQDIQVALPYPVDITLTASNLIQSGAFMASTSPSTIKDRLFVFDNSSVGINKPFSQNYVYFDLSGTDNDGWYDPNDLVAGTVDLQEVVPSGSGLMIRKPTGSPVGVAVWRFQSPLGQ